MSDVTDTSDDGLIRTKYFMAQNNSNFIIYLYNTISTDVSIVYFVLQYANICIYRCGHTAVCCDNSDLCWLTSVHVCCVSSHKFIYIIDCSNRDLILCFRILYNIVNTNYEVVNVINLCSIVNSINIYCLYMHTSVHKGIWVFQQNQIYSSCLEMLKLIVIKILMPDQF